MTGRSPTPLSLILRTGSGAAEDCYSVILLYSTYFNYLSFHVWLYSHVFNFFSVIHQDPRWYQPCRRGKAFINIGKQMQQLPTMLGTTVHRAKDVTHKDFVKQCQCACVASTMLEELCKPIEHCCATLRRLRKKRNFRSSWLKSLTDFKLRSTTPNNTQPHVTTCSRVCRRTQHVTPNVGSCLLTTLRPFEWRLMTLSISSIN